MTPRLQGLNCQFFTTPLSRKCQKRLKHKENQTKTKKDQKASESCQNFNRSNVGYWEFICINPSFEGFRACLYEDGRPQIGEVTCSGSPHLSCKRDHIKMRDYMNRRVTPPKRVTSPTWGPPPPCKQALIQINPSTEGFYTNKPKNEKINGN